MRIAIADDDDEIIEQLDQTLSAAGYVCTAFGNGEALCAAMRRDTFDLAIVDWSMPRMGGLEVLEWVKAQDAIDVPIIVLTASSSKDDALAALQAGAMDYIVKPEIGPIILARVGAALKKSGSTSGATKFDFGSYSFQNAMNHVTLNGKKIPLTPKEFELAMLLFANCNRPLSREYILQMVWHATNNTSTRTLDMHISKIRSKLSLGPANGYTLMTVFGFGYRLNKLV